MKGENETIPFKTQQILKQQKQCILTKNMRHYMCFSLKKKDLLCTLTLTCESIQTAGVITKTVRPRIKESALFSLVYNEQCFTTTLFTGLLGTGDITRHMLLTGAPICMVGGRKVRSEQRNNLIETELLQFLCTSTVINMRYRTFYQSRFQTFV